MRRLAIWYAGKVGMFDREARTEIQKAGMKRMKLSDATDCRKIQRELRKVMLRDLQTQILSGPEEAA